MPTEPEPDRLSAALAELEAVRRVPGWLPQPPDRSQPQRVLRRRLPRRARDRPDLPSAPAWRAQNGAPDHPPVEPPSSAPPSSTPQSRSERHRAVAPPVRVPTSLRGAVVAPGRWAVLGVAVVVVVAIALFATRTLLARTQSAPHPIGTTVGAITGPATSTATSRGSRTPSGGSSAAASESGTIEVHVLGQVRNPGVVTVPAGARVLDVVQAAGGLRSSADLTQVNLARKVQDGEQIVVPTPGEHPTTAAAAPTAGGSSGAATGPIDLNAADAAALDALPGVGPVLAQRIVQYRNDNGPFKSVDQLDEVSGIGAKLLDQLRPLVRV